MDFIDYYEILEVHRKASIEVIEKAYKALVFKYHPDRNMKNCVEFEEKLKLINEAYDILSDPIKRQNYDIIYDKIQDAIFSSKYTVVNNSQTSSSSNFENNSNTSGYTDKENGVSRKRNGIFFYILALCFIIPCLVILVIHYDSERNNVVTTPQSTQVVANNPSNVVQPATIKVNKIISNGYYTVGVDIPSGTYDFKSVSGYGYVGINGKLNEFMGVEGSKTTLTYSPTLSDIELHDGNVLYIQFVTIKITSDNASGVPLKRRSESITEVKKFSSGNYIVGKDFPAGTYDLKAISGCGNVSTDDVSINVIMGVKDDDGSIKTCRNVSFNNSAILSVSEVTIVLTPSN